MALDELVHIQHLSDPGFVVFRSREIPCFRHVDERVDSCRDELTLLRSDLLQLGTRLLVGRVVDIRYDSEGSNGVSDLMGQGQRRLVKHF